MTKVLIIAEAGVNHNGSKEKAFQLIDAAAAAGADIVKFQTFKAEKLVTKSAQKAAYQVANTKDDTDTSQFNMLKKLELSDDFHHELADYAQSKNIQFASTGFDEESVDLLDEMGQSFFKLPSGEITNKPLIQHIGKKGKPVILSTGMANLDEISACIEVLLATGLKREQLTVLHCNTEYPTPMEDVNLLAMSTIQNTLNVKIGYSDHTLGIEVPIAAVALGALVIEKHFTLDKTLPGPDHAASLEPAELKAMVDAIRNIEKAISGSGEKTPSASEQKNIIIARKSIVAKHTLEEGHLISLMDLDFKRPGNGISPMQLEELIGKKVMCKIQEEEQIKWEHLD